MPRSTLGTKQLSTAQRPTYRAAALGVLMVGFVLAAPGRPAQAQDDVSSTLHNLSVSGPGSVRALGETEVCKFCHIPHSPTQPEPLWGHTVSTAGFSVPEIQDNTGSWARVPQPDGSSRQCLSCHDGTVALGDIGSEPTPIAMQGTDYLGPSSGSALGLDLSGSHPVSFVVPDAQPAATDTARDMGLRALNVIRADAAVNLDAAGKMQCSSCHDPHADRFYVPGSVPRFWVKPSVAEVCQTCHELR